MEPEPPPGALTKGKGLRNQLAEIGVHALPSDPQVRNERPMRRLDALDALGIEPPAGARPDQDARELHGHAASGSESANGTGRSRSPARRQRQHRELTAAGRRRRTPVPHIELVRWTDEQAVDALLATHPRTAQRGMRSDLLNHCMELAQAVRDWSSAEGSMVGYTSMFLLAQRLYGAEIQTPDDLEAVQKSMWRWMRRLEAAHLAYFEPLVDQDSGAYIGVRWRLGHPDHLPRLDSAEPRRSSSVGSSSGDVRRFRRRPECRSERLKRRHRRRARPCGRGTPPGRFVSFFGSSYRPGGCSSSPSSKTNRGPGAHARGKVRMSDANARQLAAELAAALEAGNPASEGGEPEALARGFGGPEARARRALRRLERDRAVYEAAAARGVPASVLGAVAFARAFRRPARLSARTAEQLDRHAATLDRCADFGAGRTGAGALLLLDAIADALDAIAEGPAGARISGATPPRPRSVGWFVTDLKRLAREWAQHERARRRRRRQSPGASS